MVRMLLRCVFGARAFSPPRGPAKEPPPPSPQCAKKAGGNPPLPKRKRITGKAHSTQTICSLLQDVCPLPQNMIEGLFPTVWRIVETDQNPANAKAEKIWREAGHETETLHAYCMAHTVRVKTMSSQQKLFRNYLGKICHLNFNKLILPELILSQLF